MIRLQGNIGVARRSSFLEARYIAYQRIFREIYPKDVASQWVVSTETAATLATDCWLARTTTPAEGGRITSQIYHHLAALSSLGDVVISFSLQRML